MPYSGELDLRKRKVAEPPIRDPEVYVVAATALPRSDYEVRSMDELVADSGVRDVPLVVWLTQRETESGDDGAITLHDAVQTAVFIRRDNFSPDGTPKNTRRSEVVHYRDDKNTGPRAVHLVGYKPPDASDPGDVRLSWRDRAGAAGLQVQEVGAETVAVYLTPEMLRSNHAAEIVAALAEGFGDAAYNRGIFMNEGAGPKEEADLDPAVPPPAPRTPEAAELSVRSGVKTVVLAVNDASCRNELLAAFQKGDRLAATRNLVRFLADTDSSQFTPAMMVKLCLEFERLLSSEHVTVEVYDKDQLQAAGLNALLAVHAGSKRQGPFHIRLKYRPPAAADKPVHVVQAKCLTFDDGGSGSPKGGDHSPQMKRDMTFAADALAAFVQAVEEGVPVKLDVSLAACENRIDGGAYMSDDVLTFCNGVQAVVENTDAEGRLAQYDCLAHTRQLITAEGAEIGLPFVGDTLTGHAVAVSGDDLTVLSVDKERGRRFQDLAESVGEPANLLPIRKSDVKSVDGRKDKGVGLKNVGVYAKKKQRGSQGGHAFILSALSEAERKRAVCMDIASGGMLAEDAHPSGLWKGHASAMGAATLLEWMRTECVAHDADWAAKRATGS